VALKERFRRPAGFRAEFTRRLVELDGQPRSVADATAADATAADATDAGGDAELAGAASLAGDWWRARRTDALLVRHGSPPTARLAVVWRSFVVVERCPEARWSVLDLGRELDREGLLAGPFDERAEARGGPVDPHEPGPSRLAALVTMAAYSGQLRRPDRRRWRRRAIDGSARCPGAVGALVGPVRALLDGIA
jgi:hypothetical protein